MSLKSLENIQYAIGLIYFTITKMAAIQKPTG